MPDPPEPPAPPSAPPAAGWTPVILVGLLLAALSIAPYVRAHLSPPPGHAFVGFFWFVDDSYNYLSFVEQAEAGAVLFHNKLVLEDHPAVLFNLEWWTVGVLSRLLGGHPLVGYRVFGLAALAALVLGIDRWLAGAGLPASHRVPALLLVTTGAGLGGIRLLVGTEIQRCLDLTTGFFPVLEALSNPHFVAGTALLVWALLAHAAPAGARSFVVAAALGTALGLTRPYDLLVLVAVRTVVVVIMEPARAWWRHAAAMAALLPVAAYNYWVFYRQPAFTFYTEAAYVFPTRADLAWALGPAAALAVAALAVHPEGGARSIANFREGPGGVARLHFAAWCAIALVVFAFRPVHFSLQFLVGVGLPLLALAAVGLGRRPVGYTIAAVLALSSTAVAALWLTLQPTRGAYAPAERFALAWDLRRDCFPGDRLVAPADIGLWAGGFSACQAFTSHAIEPAHSERREAVRMFYEQGDPAGRAAFLERVCATHVVLPASRPAAHWVDPRVGLEPVAVAGTAGRQLAAYRINSSCRKR
jgi:hypothetical protein